jgi:hypothetical protein
MILQWRQRPLLTLAFVLALSMTLFFAGRFVYQAVYWANHQNVEVRGWMTVGYIARSWGLKPHEIDQMANLPAPPGHPLPLVEIARMRNVPVSEVIAEVEAAIATLTARKAAP